MRTALGLSAALVVADSTAQATGDIQTIVLDKDTLWLTVLPAQEYRIIVEAEPNPFGRPLASVYPDGRVDLYRQVALPKEVCDVH